MKKSTLFASALLLGASLTASAQGAMDVYMSGAFNNYDPADNPEWQLKFDTEAEEAGMSIYRGTFEIPAGQCSFNLNAGGLFTLCPGLNADEPSETSVNIAWDDDFYAGIFSYTGLSQAYWVDSAWEGGLLEVIVDLDSSEIMLSKVGAGDPAEGNVVYVAGAWNNYAPEGQEIWSLTAIDEGSFRGTFEVPAGQLSFYLQYNGISFVPGVTEDGDVVPAEGSVDVLQGDDFYNGMMATTGFARTYWQNLAWEGGAVEITADIVNQEVIISKVGDDVVEIPNVYVAGAFNDNNPEGLEIWQLNALEDGTSVRGTFNIPEGQFKLHFVSDMFEIIPATLNSEGELEGVVAPVNVVDGDEYNFTTTGMANPNAYWTVENWDGGFVEMTIDFVNHTVVFSLDAEAPADLPNVFVSGAFNEFAPEGLEIWKLNPVGDGSSVRGTFDIPAGQFSLHFASDMYELVPAVKNADDELEASTSPVNVVDGEQYAFTTTGMANPNSNWTVANWEGGLVEMTVDFENNIVIFSLENAENPETGINLFVAGAWNEYAPEGLEIWQLGAIEDGTDIYRGTFEVPAGQFSLHFVSDMFELVPAVMNAQGELEAETTPVYVEDGVQYAFTSTGVANPNANWTVANWEGGYVEMTVDFANNIVIFSLGVEPPFEGGANLYVAGAFNEYAPEGLEIWQLGTLEDDANIYRGTFEIPAGQFSLHFQSDMFELVPAVENAEGELEAATAPVAVVDGDQYAFTSTGLANPAANWTVENWEGGYVEMTVDFENNIVIFSLDVEPPFQGLNLYVSGAFNEFAPEGLEIWQLGALEDDANTYRGTFEVPAGQFSLHFVSDMFEIVPAVKNAEGELEAATAPVAVVDGDVYDFTTTGIANPNANWTVANWEGGYVEMTVDLANNIVIFSLDVDAPTADVWYVRGPFNEFMPFGNAAYALTPEDDNNGVYTGTIDIPAGQFEINFLSPYATIFIPASINSEVISFTGDTFTGNLDAAYDEFEEGYTWSDPTWAGGKVTITIDANEGTVTFVKAESGVNSIDAENGNEVIYNLNGVRVDRNKLDKGIYIINGKKVIF